MEETLRELITTSDNIVFFGGAGVSTESGIPDFRSETGIYNAQQKYGYSPEEMLSHTFFMNHTDQFYDFYKTMMIYPEAMPNATHKALAKLEEMGKLRAVITQNIDGLHQAAGSQEVYELHGSVHRNYCMKCHKAYSLETVLKAGDVPRCSACGGIIKPDVVLYEEGLNGETISKSIAAIANAQVLIVGGTSLNVYPAAGFLQYYKGKHLVLINKSVTAFDKHADLLIHDSLGKVFTEVMSCL